MTSSTSQGVNERDTSNEVVNSIELEKTRELSEKARELAESGKLVDAINLFKKIVNITPNHVEYLVEFGKLLAKIGEYSNSCNVFEKILILEPTHTKILPNYQRSLVKSGKSRQASKIFEKHLKIAVKISPNNSDLLYKYAGMFRALNNSQKALEILGCALKIDPFNTDLSLDYVKILLKDSSINELIMIIDYLLGYRSIENPNLISKDFDVHRVLLNFFGNDQIGRENKARQVYAFSYLIKEILKTQIKARKYKESLNIIRRYFQLSIDGFQVLLFYINRLKEVREYDTLYQLIKENCLNTPEEISLISFTTKSLSKDDPYYKLGLIKIERLLHDYLGNNVQNKIDDFLQGDSSFLIEKARILCERENIDKAKKIWRFLYLLDPLNPKIISGYSSFYLKNNIYHKNDEIHEDLLDLLPNNATLLNRYASILIQNGNQEKACELFERALILEENNLSVLANYANVLSKQGKYEQASVLFDRYLQLNGNNSFNLVCYAHILLKQCKHEKAAELFELILKLDGDSISILNNYANTLVQQEKYDLAFELFDRALKLDRNDTWTISNYAKSLGKAGLWQRLVGFLPQHSYARLKYAHQLEKEGSYEKALSQLLAINLASQKSYHLTILQLNIGRLYYRLGQPNLGKQFFDEAIANSDEQDKSILYAARSLLATNPNSQEAINLLLKIQEDSPRYAEAMKAIALNADAETSYELFGADEEQIDDIEMLYRAMYHKIGNEIAVLRSISYRLLRRMEGEHPLVKEIVNDLEKLQQGIASQRANEKAAIAQTSHSNYKQLIGIVSKTAHDISDEVNNQLAVIESKTRRAERKLATEDPQYQQFEKFLSQLKITQTALNDLKSINEGKTIRRNRFLVHQLFEKWEPANWTSQPRIDGVRIRLDIRNPDSEFNGDEEKIKSILNELVENSLKHNHGNSNLSIRMYSSDLLNPQDISSPKIPGDRKFLYIEFSDNGQGVPNDKKEWIFQPLKTTSPEDKGSGLGLFIARKTIKKMGGQIREVGEVGKGVRFQIYLPYLSSNAL